MQIKTKYRLHKFIEKNWGHRATRVPIYSGVYRFDEAIINALIIRTLAFEGTWYVSTIWQAIKDRLYEERDRLSKSHPITDNRIPDKSTIFRHISNLKTKGYVEELPETISRPGGPVTLYDLTDKGRVAAEVLPDVRKNFSTYLLDWEDETSSSYAFLKVLAENELNNIPQYFNNLVLDNLLAQDFEHLSNEQVRIMKEIQMNVVVWGFIHKIEQGKQLPEEIKKDGLSLIKIFKNKPEMLKRFSIEIDKVIQERKNEIGFFQKLRKTIDNVDTIG